jgi:16S rRNA (uracil1498-N3)-methyltransferase
MGYSMRRFFVEQIPIPLQDQSLVIKGAEAGHINRVLRMGPGVRVLLMDAEGFRCEAVIESADRHEVHLRIERTLAPPQPSPIEITLCQALLKSQSMDFVIQKTSELGVHHVQPFYSERTVVKIQRERVHARLKRWQGIAVSAAKQADRLRPAEVHEPRSFAEVVNLAQTTGVLKIILHEKEGRDLKSLLRSTPEANRITGMVGPEGGFPPDEVKAAREAGFLPIYLGRRILRAETAALTLVAILQYEWGDLSLRE